MSARWAASSSSPSIAIVAPCRAASARSRSANATSGWNAPAWVPAARAGRSTSAPSRPLVWTIAWPAYRRSDAGDRDDRVVGDREDHELDVVDERIRLGEPACAGDVRAEPLPAAGIARRDGADGPARPVERDPQRRSRRRPRRRSRPPDARPGPRARAGGRGRSACSRSPWRCGARAPAGSRVDALLVELAERSPRGRRRGARPARRRTSSVSSQALIGPLPCPGGVRAVRFHATSVASGPRAHPHRPIPIGGSAMPRHQRIRSPSLAGRRPARPLPALRAADVGPRARRRPRAGARHPQDPARERAPPRRRRHRPRGGRRGARGVAPGRRGRGRDPVHARPRGPPGLHRRARGRRPRGDARRDGGPRRRPARSTRSCPRTSSSTTRCRSTRGAARARSRSTSEREYERNGERYQLLRWAQTAFRDLRVVPARHRDHPPGQPRVPGDRRRRTARTRTGGSPTPTRSWAPTRTRRWSTGSASSATASAGSRPRPSCSASRCTSRCRGSSACG